MNQPAGMQQMNSKLKEAQDSLEDASSLLTRQIVDWLNDGEIEKTKLGIRAQECLMDLRAGHEDVCNLLVQAFESPDGSSGVSQASWGRLRDFSKELLQSNPTRGSLSKRKVKRKKKQVKYSYDRGAQRLSYHCKPKNGGEYTHHVSLDAMKQVATVCDALSGTNRSVFDWSAIEPEVTGIKQYQVRLAIRFFIEAGAMHKVPLSEAGRRGCYACTDDCGEPGQLFELVTEKLATLD